MKTCSDPLCSPCHNPNYERKEIAFAGGWLSRGSHKRRLTGRFIDVGAHTGLWSIAINKVYAQLNINADIFAFEPDPITFESLVANLDSIKRATTIQAAAWNNERGLILSADPHPAKRHVSIEGKGTQVRAITVDSICGNLITDLIKIDVEGAEFEVLQGAESVLIQPGRRLLMMEWCLSRRGFPTQAVLKFLKLAGYGWIQRSRKALLRRKPMTISLEAFEKPE